MATCPVCGEYFETYRGMRTHLWRMHPFEYREIRLKEEVKKWGVPDEITDNIDFHAYVDTSVSLQENINDLIRAYPILRRYEKPIEEEDIEQAEEKVRKAAVTQAKEYITETIENVLKQFDESEREEIKQHLSELAGLEEIEKRIEERVEKKLSGKIKEIYEETLKKEEEYRAKLKELDELLKKKMELEEEKKEEEKIEREVTEEPTEEKEIMEHIEEELMKGHPDMDFDISIKDSKITITAFPKRKFKKEFKKGFKAKVSGDIYNYKELIKEITDIINKARGHVFLPYHIIEGLKIFFKCKDMDKVLKVIYDVSGVMLSEWGIFEAKEGVCYIPFDLRRIGLRNEWRPTNQKLAKYIDIAINEMKNRGIKIYVDTETGIDPDTNMIYPVNYNDIIFITEEEEELEPEEVKTLQEYAVERLADYLAKEFWEEEGEGEEEEGEEG